MKILFFLAHPNSIGGAMKVLLTQAHIIHNFGHHILVVIQNNETNEHIFEIDELCKKWGLDFVSAQYPIATCIEEIDILKALEKYDEIYELVTRFQPDIIHSVQINVTVELVARKLNIPHLMNIYQISKDMFSLNWINIFPEYHCCDSLYYSDQWANGLHIESRCIRVAYEPQSVKKRSKTTGDQGYHLINIASFAEHKRQLEIIKFVELCNKVHNKNVRIVFLGNNSGWYGDICREYIEKEGLSDYVTFVGQVVNVEKYLLQSDLMIHASAVESYPGVIVEAMANRIPVITTPVAGIPELVKSKQNGFLAKNSEPVNLYAAFLEYEEFVLEKKISYIKDNAYETYLNYHTFEIVGRQLTDYYKYIENRNRQNQLQREDLIEIFKSYDDKDLSDFTRNKIWYLYHLKRMLQENQSKSCIIWGAGYFGNIAMEWCDVLELQLKGFIDSNKVGEYKNYPIYSNDDIVIKKVDFIIVAIGNVLDRQNVMCTLEKQGKKRNKDYILMLNDPCLHTS